MTNHTAIELWINNGPNRRLDISYEGGGFVAKANINGELFVSSNPYDSIVDAITYLNRRIVSQCAVILSRSDDE